MLRPVWESRGGVWRQFLKTRIADCSFIVRWEPWGSCVRFWLSTEQCAVWWPVHLRSVFRGVQRCTCRVQVLWVRRISYLGRQLAQVVILVWFIEVTVVGVVAIREEVVLLWFPLTSYLGGTFPVTFSCWFLPRGDHSKIDKESLVWGMRIKVYVVLVRWVSVRNQCRW